MRAQLAGSTALIAAVLYRGLMPAPAWAQAKRTIFVITDAEGVAGVCRPDQTDPKDAEMRQLLIGETNAAVEGFLAGGADEVIVLDGHDGSQSLSTLTIHPKAKLLTGATGPTLTLERRYAALAFVGQPAGLLSRRYRDGERLSYLMKGRNNDRTYQVRLTAVVKRRADGQFVEEYAWSDLVVDGVPQPLTPASQAFRQAVTLAGGSPFTMPDLSKVQPALIGPVTDLLTFYADLFLATHSAQLREPGDRFIFANPMVSSWADGTRVLIGEDSIDFDIRLTGVDRSRGVTTLLVKHVPPKAPKIRIPAEWMRAPVAGTPNNWVQVRRAAGVYIGAVGKETFDVELMIRLSAGEIWSATMDNLVEAVARECVDVELSDCGERRPDRTVRRIEMSLTDSGL